MGGSRQTQTTNTTQNTNQNTTTPGTQPATQAFNQIQGSDLLTRALNTSAFTGDRVATTSDPGQFAAQWGATPANIVTQRTAGDTPMQTNQTWVNSNYEPGIQAGLDSVAGMSAPLSNIASAGLGQIESRLAGGENSGLQPLLASLRDQHESTSARTQNQIAQAFGAVGANGGSNMGRESAWAAGEQQRAFDANAAQLIWDNYLNNQNFMMAAPELTAGYAGVGTMGAEGMLRYGGLRQENQAGQAAVDDTNRQAAENNLWRSLTIQDTNAQLAAENDMAVRDANYQAEDARVRDQLSRAQWEQANTQAGYDNDFLRWLSEQETLQSQIANAGGYMALPGMIPGSSTTGQATTNSTTTTREQANPWQVAASLGGAALSAFGGGGAGGLFSGALSALGGGANRANALPVPNIPSFQLDPNTGRYVSSDRRLKKDIVFLFSDWRGVKWYSYHYIGDEGKIPRVGVMADEIQSYAPELVAQDEAGFLKVNYTGLDSWEPARV